MFHNDNLAYKVTNIDGQFDTFDCNEDRGGGGREDDQGGSRGGG